MAGSIFDDLSGAQESQVEKDNTPGLESIFSAEFLARFGADEVNLALKGVVKAIKGVYHPDALLSKLDSEIVDEINSGVRSEDLSEGAQKVTELQRKGAEVVDEFTKLGDKVAKDPADAKLSALEIFRRRGEHIISPKRKDNTAEFVEQRRRSKKLEDDHEVITPQVLERKRQIFEMLYSDFALHNYPLTCVAEDVDGNLVLATIKDASDATLGSDIDFGVITRRLRPLIPHEDRAQSEVIGEFVAKMDARLADNMEQDELDKRSGLTEDKDYADLTFNVNERSEKLGSQGMVNYINKLNLRIGTGENGVPSDYTDYYELAVLRYDDEDRPYYELLPTTQGISEGMRPIEDEKGIIADWSLNLFREMPDVVRFRTVMGRTKKDPGILRAWAYKADKPEKTVSYDSASGKTDNTFVCALGFVPNADHFEQVASTTEARAELMPGKSYVQKTKLKVLDPETDIAVLSGNVGSFSPHLEKGLVEPDDSASHSRLRPDLLVRLQVGGNYSASGSNIEPIDETQMYALKNVHALGIDSHLRNDKKGIEIYNEARQGLQLIQEALDQANSGLFVVSPAKQIRAEDIEY